MGFTRQTPFVNRYMFPYRNGGFNLNGQNLISKIYTLKQLNVVQKNTPIKNIKIKTIFRKIT